MAPFAWVNSPTRALWAASEPFVLGLLVASEARAILGVLGVPDRSAYFAVRSAPLGRCESAVVVSAFHGFHSSAIDAVLPALWDQIRPRDVISCHLESLRETAARLFTNTVNESSLQYLCDQLSSVCAQLDMSGRPMAAANQAVDPPPELWARFWQACSILREYRGDAHIAALVAADLSAIESLVLHSIWARGHIDVDLLRTSRQLSAAQWSQGIESLTDRGIVSTEAELTASGRALREEIEVHTDIASSRPWRILGADNCVALYELTSQLSYTVVAGRAMRAITPVGAPWPPPEFRSI